MKVSSWVSESLIGLPTCLVTVPLGCATSTTMLQAWTCGSLRACSKLLTGAQGIRAERISVSRCSAVLV